MDHQAALSEAVSPPLLAAGQSRAGHEPGRVLVQFHPGANPISVAQAHGASPSRQFIPGVWLARVPEGHELTVAAALAQNPNVIFAEPDYKRVFGDPLCPNCPRPSDNLFEWQWNMHNDGDVDLGLGLLFPTTQVDADIDWLEAFGVLGPSPMEAVKIGVLDTGIRASHADFCGKQVIWKDFYPNPSPTPFDDHGHGTHVSGIAGACSDNGEGVVGVAYGPNMDFVVGKVCAADGNCLASAISEAIYWAVDSGAEVINMSFGDTQQSQAEALALAYAASHNVLPVCAAGNDGIPTVLYPAADPNCVAVSATNFGDGLASYSSFGPQVELSAPGGDLEDFLFGTSMIASTWAGWDTDYVATAGTSMAAPHVTGLAALIRALGVNNAADVRACLRNTADDLGEAGWDERFGWGRINMHQAVVNVGSCSGSGGGGEPGENVTPAAAFSHTCDALTCSFDGSSSWDPDGTIVSHDWDFGDGSTGAGAAAIHTYSAPGTYTARLTVVDDDGASDQSSAEISVGIIHVSDLEGWSEKGKANRWRAFLEVTVVDTEGGPVDGATVSVDWTGAITGTVSQVTDTDGIALVATGNIRGEGAVTFTVSGLSHPAMTHDPALDRDADGDSDGKVYDVGAPNDLPQAGFIDNCGALVCSFTDVSTDSDGTIVSWEWDFGDLETSNEPNPTHTFATSSFYLVSLTVTDDKGATDTEDRFIFVPELDVGLALSATPSKVKGIRRVDLSWTGGTGLWVDIKRDGVIIHTTEEPVQNYTDILGRKSESSYTYKVCEAGTNVCSNEATVAF